MKITVESTSKIVELLSAGAVHGVPARLWEGRTESGIPVHVFITRIAVANDRDTAQFEQELLEVRAPSADVQAYPLRMVL